MAIDYSMIPVPYLLEVWSMVKHEDGKKYLKLTSAIALPIPPESLRVTRPHATGVAYSFGMEPVREHSVNREVQLELAGRSGLAMRRGFRFAGGKQPTELLAPAPAPSLVESLSDFLQAYQKEATQANASKGSVRCFATRMVFRALDEKVHLQVEPVTFELLRQARLTRLGYEWRLSLRGYASADTVVRRDPAPKADRSAETLTLAMQVGDKADALLATGSRYVNKYLRQPVRQFNAVVKVCRRTLEATGQLVQSADPLGHLVVAGEQLAAVLHDARRSAQALGRAVGAEWERLVSVWGFARDLVREGTTAYAVAGGTARALEAIRSAREQAGAAGPPSNIASTLALDSQVTVYTLGPGEDLKDVALKVLGDAGAWLGILLLNGFVDTTHGADGGPLMPGTKVLVPAPVGKDDVANTVDGLGTPAALYGTDLLIDPRTGDLAIDGTSRTGLRCVSGVDNVRQALRHRLLTRQGETKVLAGYGLPIAPGQVVSALTAGFAAAHVREQLLHDERVAAVDELEVGDGGDTIAVVAEVALAGGSGIGVAVNVGLGT